MNFDLKIALTLCLLFPVLASSETVCKSKLSYKWKKADAQEEQSVDAGVVEASAPDEASAKAKLNDLLSDKKAKVALLCRNERENSANCISSKYEAMASTLNAMRFEARKALDQAIATDCVAQQGVCGAVVAADPECAEKVAAGQANGTPAADAEAGKTAAKDAGKGKKK